MTLAGRYLDFGLAEAVIVLATRMRISSSMDLAYNLIVGFQLSEHTEAPAELERLAFSSVRQFGVASVHHAAEFKVQFSPPEGHQYSCRAVSDLANEPSAKWPYGRNSRFFNAELYSVCSVSENTCVANDGRRRR